jgi:L-2-hydroxycarboxylate dehydrogenase (NAD+)
MCTKGDLVIALDPSKFSNPETFKEEVDDFIAEVKGSGNVFIPGDMEVRNIKDRKENGIAIDENLMNQIKAIAEELSFDMDKIIK